MSGGMLVQCVSVHFPCLYPGSAAILAAISAGETPALPGGVTLTAVRHPKPGLIILKNRSCERVKNVDSLIQDLQKTIDALETLSDMPATAGEQIDELLDQLFQQKIDLVNATLNVSSQLFLAAAQAMALAASKAVFTVKEPSQVNELAKGVSDAITKLARLLDSAAHIN